MDRIGAKHVIHHMIVEKGEGQFGNLAWPSRGRLRYCGRRRWLRKTENVQRIQEANTGGGPLIVTDRAPAPSYLSFSFQDRTLGFHLLSYFQPAVC
jgi:hypothetical protein